MDDFGARLEAFRRGRRLKNAELATRALGEHATKGQLRDLASYFGRIERGEVPSPGLKQLQQLAKGYGLTLSDFFLRIEHAEGHNGTARTPAHLPDRQIVTENRRPDGGSALAEGHMDDHPVPSRTALAETFAELAATCARAAVTLAGEQTPDSRVDQPSRRPRDRKYRG